MIEVLLKINDAISRWWYAELKRVLSETIANSFQAYN